MSFVKARNIATVIVGCSSIVPNDNMLFVGDKESLPFTVGVDVTDAGANLGRLAPGLKKTHNESREKRRREQKKSSPALLTRSY